MTTLQTINIGTYANDGTGDDLRTAFTKVNSNFTAINTTVGAANVGSGVGVFAGKPGTDLQFKSFVSAGGTVAITGNTNTINLESVSVVSTDHSPSLGGNLNLNSHSIYGGDSLTTVYGYNNRITEGLISILLNSNNFSLDMGSYTSPTATKDKWDFGSNFASSNNKINLGVLSPLPTSTKEGLVSSSIFRGAYTDGIVVDYTTGTGRISVGTADGISFYNGGVANTLLGSVSSTGVWNFPSITTSSISVALGSGSAAGTAGVAIGNTAGGYNQGQFSVAVGASSAQTSQGGYAVAVGYTAGANNQGNNAVSIGNAAGVGNQGTSAIAIGQSAGGSNQSTYGIAIGVNAGYLSQGNNAIAIGLNAGQTGQGASSIAIGQGAGVGIINSQAANTIILNATGSSLEGIANQTSSFYVAPIRNDATPTNVLYYNTTTKEVSYGTAYSYTLPTASTTVLGGVKVDGTSITITGGVISASSGFTLPANTTFSTSALDQTVTTPFALLATPATVTSFAGATTLTVGYSGTGVNNTTNISTAAIANTFTKTVNIGTNGATGSTTNINIGTGSSGTVTVTVGANATFNGSASFTGALKSGGGATNITLGNNGPSFNGITTMGIRATPTVAPTISSAATIGPSSHISFVSGTTQITTITAPSGITSTGGSIILIPTGLWTTGTTGNIALATTAVVNKALIMVYDATTTKWYPSY